MANPPTTTKEVVLCLNDETMQRLIVGIADDLRNATFSQSTSQQLPVTKFTVETTTSSGSKFLSLLHSVYLSNRHDIRVHTRLVVGGYTTVARSNATFAVEVLVLSLLICAPLNFARSKQRAKLHKGREIWELYLDLQEFMATGIVWKSQAVHVTHN